MNPVDKQLFKKLFKENIYCTIATASKKGKPWITPVYFAYDQNYNLYWYSPKNSKHSQLICNNSYISLVIFDSHATGADVQAVYINAQAYEINKHELPNALKIYFNRQFAEDKLMKKKMIQAPEDFLGRSPLRMYKAVPQKFYLLNPSRVYKDKWVDSRKIVSIT